MLSLSIPKSQVESLLSLSLDVLINTAQIVLNITPWVNKEYVMNAKLITNSKIKIVL